MPWADEEPREPIGDKDWQTSDVRIVSSNPSYPFEEVDSRILRGYCGSGKSAIRPKLYLDPGPVPRKSFAEDE